MRKFFRSDIYVFKVLQFISPQCRSPSTLTKCHGCREMYQLVRLIAEISNQDTVLILIAAMKIKDGPLMLKKLYNFTDFYALWYIKTIAKSKTGIKKKWKLLIYHLTMKSKKEVIRRGKHHRPRDSTWTLSVHIVLDLSMLRLGCLERMKLESLINQIELVYSKASRNTSPIFDSISCNCIVS